MVGADYFTVAPAQELPAPAVQPKQCGPVTIARVSKTCQPCAPRSITQVEDRLRGAGRDPEVEHLIEVAVVQTAVPSDAAR